MIWILTTLIFMAVNANSGSIYQIRKMNYLALGDSYTIGESVAINERYPVQLVEKLKSQGVTINSPEIIAKTGWTTSELIPAIDAANLSANYDLVTLLIGVNNQYRGLDINEYKNEFEALLKKSIELAGGDHTKVIVISIPDYGVTPFGVQKGKDSIGEEIDRFNEVNRASAFDFNVHYTDITVLSRKALLHQEYTADDGLHPSAKMYELWVDKLAPLALNILRHASAK